MRSGFLTVCLVAALCGSFLVPGIAMAREKKAPDPEKIFAKREANGDGSLTLEKLEAMTSVCSVGIDMVVIPGDTDADTIAAIIADEMAIGVINKKTTAVRVIPAPGKGVGDCAVFGGLFGTGHVAAVRNAGRSGRFVQLGGRIPAPLQSLNN